MIALVPYPFTSASALADRAPQVCPPKPKEIHMTPQRRLGESLAPIEGDTQEPQVFAVGALLTLYGFALGVAVSALVSIFIG